jgi:hypothetical protein
LIGSYGGFRSHKGGEEMRPKIVLLDNVIRGLVKRIPLPFDTSPEPPRRRAEVPVRKGAASLATSLETRRKNSSSVPPLTATT